MLAKWQKLRTRSSVAAFVCISSLIASGPETSGQELNTDFLVKLHGVPFCEAGRHFGVPAELVAAVFLRENVLMRGLVDSAQDAIFTFLAEHRDEQWWENWARDAMHVADESEPTRLIANKWPPDVVKSGVVFSIGPAQITPRTALQACASFETKPALCADGVRSLIRQLLSDEGAAELAAMVLHFEQRTEQRQAGVDVSGDLGRWATIYNVGGDYYRSSFSSDASANGFGRWVRTNAETFRQELKCSNLGPQPLKSLD